MKVNNTDDASKTVFQRDQDRRTGAVNRPSEGSILLPEMENGRDEMNLVEFPLAALASRLPKGKDTLVFEDWIWDKRQRVNVRKRLTVAASSEFGLPTASDDEVILGLVQLAKAGEFADRSVSFLPVELFRLLGWREDGRSYSRLETSLKRWLGVTLYYDHAWWDNDRKVWCDEHFHLLEHITVRRRPRGAGGGALCQKQPWSVTWNEVMYRSCRSGYLKRLDMGLYRRLTLAAAKRMYRFLDKRFYFTNRLTFNLRTFACEHIGFRRGDDNAQLKRRLNRAIEQLEEAGFLESLSVGERYRKLRRGQWEVVFVRKRMRKRKTRETGGVRSREVDLVKRGIRPPVAVRLVRDHAETVIDEAVRKFDRLMERQKDGALDNPPGLLVAWVREGEERQRSHDTGEKPRPAKANPANEARVEAIRKRNKEWARAERKREAIRAYLDSLSAEELEVLETEAVAAANPFLVKGYRRHHAGGTDKVFREYRAMILESHVQGLPGILDMPCG